MRFSYIAILLMFLLLSGCSVSYSLGKSSDSISASSDSISASSDSSGDDDAADVAANRYMDDVVAATVSFVSDQAGSDAFQKTITGIALNHGIVDWEQEDMTYKAMGQGLKRAGVDVHTIAEYPFFRVLTNRAAYSLVLTGYHHPS